MQSLLQAGLLKDIGVFAGVGAVLMTVQRLQRPAAYDCLTDYPRVTASGFARLLNALHALGEHERFDDIVRMCDNFLAHVGTGNSGCEGFVANRLASQIPERISEVVRRASRSNDLGVATRAMDFERDELPQIRGLCDDLVRNMLLASRPYS